MPLNAIYIFTFKKFSITLYFHNGSEIWRKYCGWLVKKRKIAQIVYIISTRTDLNNFSLISLPPKFVHLALVIVFPSSSCYVWMLNVDAVENNLNRRILGRV